MSDKGVTVMLVDDHAVVRTGYRMLLEMTGEFSVIAEIDCGEGAVDEYARLRPDIVIMDLNMPGISGIEATRRMIQMDPEAKVLIFSIHDEPVYVSRALDAGAHGYLCKSCAPSEMVEAARTVAAGHLYADSGFERSMTSGKVRGQKDPLTQLSPREFEVFQLLGKGSSSREIAVRLDLSSKTVSNYLTLIKEKLGLNSSTELVKVAAHFLSLNPPEN